jgi:NAD+ kinase
MSKRRVLILANSSKAEARDLALVIQSHVVALGIEGLITDGSRAASEDALSNRIDLVISLGGDGTVLAAARLASPSGIPILPFNLGNLGFIAGFGRSDWRVCLDAWSEGQLGLSSRLMLAISVLRDGELIASHIALNDGVVAGHGIAKIICLELKAGGYPMGVYRSDGVIVATPTGSTAYNLAAGGPVLHPETDSMVINPICPFTLSHRPLVVPGTERIELAVESLQRTGVILTVDGQETCALLPGDRVLFSRAPRKALIYVPERVSFYEILRAKLNWSGGSDA